MKFLPGHSGNPSGRPKSRISELARKHDAAAIETLASIMNKSRSDMARIAAATALLDRGWGKPVQPIGGDPEGMPIIHEHRAVVLAEIHRIIAAQEADGGDGSDGRGEDGGTPLRLERSASAGRTDPTDG
jgi:hypothetical protein